MHKVFIGWCVFMVVMTALALVDKASASPETDAYTRGVKDTLAHLYKLCMDDQAFTMVGVDGSEVTFMCIEKRGQYL